MKSSSLLVQNAIHFNYVSVREGVYTRQAWCLGVWLEVVREQENSNLHPLVVQGKHRSGEVEQALAGEATDYFPFLVFCFYFLSAIHVFLLCVLPLAHFLTHCLQCWLSSKSLSCKERHHGSWTVPSICTVVAAGEFCGVLWADSLFCFFLAIVSLLGCLLWSRIVHRHRGHRNRCSFAISEESEQLLYCGSFLSILDIACSCCSFGDPSSGSLVRIRSCSFFFFFFRCDAVPVCCSFSRFISIVHSQ